MMIRRNTRLKVAVQYLRFQRCYVCDAPITQHDEVNTLRVMTDAANPLNFTDVRVHRGCLNNYRNMDIHHRDILRRRLRDSKA